MAEIVVITGAAGGVGRATARALRGTRMPRGAGGRSAEALRAAAREVEAAGGQALVFPAEVADADAIEAAAEAAEEKFGPIGDRGKYFIDNHFKHAASSGSSQFANGIC